jgi:hypothetical protein
MSRIYYWSKNFQGISDLIDKLSEEEVFLIPRFLLRAQLIEFALKYLLRHAPYKPVKGLGRKQIEKMTMGEVIIKLEECNDGHLSSIINSAKVFKDLRDEITHHLVDSEKSLSEISKSIKKNLGLAEEIEAQIAYFAGYVEEVLKVNFEEIH